MSAYTCPDCGKAAIITESSRDTGTAKINIAASNIEYESRVRLSFQVIVCPNPECKKLNLAVDLEKTENSYPYAPTGESIEHWHLLPESTAKPMPSYVPESIVSDYKEACRIKDLSPKAAATLARRALQGMIRDFFGIKRDTLFLEIDALKTVLPTTQWNAIDALRKIGNIGAHMEKDVDTIIDIEPDEASKLIAFLEYLIEAWYIKRHEDEERLANIVEIAGLKKDRKN